MTSCFYSFARIFNQSSEMASGIKDGSLNEDCGAFNKALSRAKVNLNENPVYQRRVDNLSRFIMAVFSAIMIIIFTIIWVTIIS